MTQFTTINYIKISIPHSHFDALCISLAEVGAVNGVVIAVERHCLFMQPPSLRISVSAQGLKKMQWAMHCAKMAVKKYQQKTNQDKIGDKYGARKQERVDGIGLGALP